MILGIFIVLALIIAIFWPEKEVFGNFLSSEIEKIENYVDQSVIVNDKVSKGTVGWHLAHVLMVVGSVYKQLEMSDPSSYKWKFNTVRTLVFTINGIPRGKGKSPDRVRPDDHITQEEVQKRLKAVRAMMEKFEALPKGANFNHLYFGMLTRGETKKFIKIHTNHHLKIVKDILKS